MYIEARSLHLFPFQVRVKPKLTKLEMDLIVDTTGDNYDQDADEHLLIKKQVSGALQL